jgi:hypothetical protein
MKKITLIIVAFLISGSMFGQFHFGPQIGYSASKLSLNANDISSSIRSNFLAGIFVRLGKKIYVQPEVNWMTQGSVFKYPEVKLGGGSDLSPFEQDIKLSSVNIPVSLGWRIINLEVVNIRLFAGVNADIVVNKTINNSQDISDVDEDLFKPITEADIKDLAWNYQAGLGVDVLMFAIDVKYVGSFGEPIAGDIHYNSETKTLSSRTSMFLVTLGWKIF